jgi:hypothetical protein
MNGNFDSRSPRCVADVLGLGSLEDGEPGMDPELLKELYRHARDEDGMRCLFENDPSFASGWINLDSARARELVSAFVPMDDADSLKEARRNAQANLEAQAWNDLLNIDMPIVCKVKIHGAKWGLRFQSAEATMRGQEILNEFLPQIPIDGNGSPVEATSDVDLQDPPASSHETQPTHDSPRKGTAEDVLKRAGLPE